MLLSQRATLCERSGVRSRLPPSGLPHREPARWGRGSTTSGCERTTTGQHQEAVRRRTTGDGARPARGGEGGRGACTPRWERHRRPPGECTPTNARVRSVDRQFRTARRRGGSTREWTLRESPITQHPSACDAHLPLYCRSQRICMSTDSPSMQHDPPSRCLPAAASTSAPVPGCIFCQLAPPLDPSQPLSPTSQERILFQDEICYVVRDIRPAARLHLLVITRQHVRDCDELARKPAKYEALGQPLTETGTLPARWSRCVADVDSPFSQSRIFVRSARSSCSITATRRRSLASASTCRPSSAYRTSTCTC